MLRCPHCHQCETFLVHEYLDHHILIHCTPEEYTVHNEYHIEEKRWEALTCPACQHTTTAQAAREAFRSTPAPATPEAPAPEDTPGLIEALRRKLEDDGDEGFIRSLLHISPIGHVLAEEFTTEAQEFASGA